MLVIDYPHDDPKLRHGFTVRTTLTATIYDQALQRGRPARPVAPLTAEERESFLAATDTFDFDKPEVKIAAMALLRTFAIAIVLALATGLIKAAVGFDLWNASLGLSTVVLMLCLTFFVTDNHVGEDMSIKRLAGMVAAMPLTTLAVVVAAMMWNFGVDLVQDQVRPLRKAVMMDDEMPIELRMALVALYMAVFTYLRISATAALFVALHAFWSYRRQPPSSMQPPASTLLARRR